MSQSNILYRQIHPSWIVDEAVSSQAFRPTPKDKGKLSVYDGTKFSPQSSFEHFTDKNLRSEGVLGVTNGECEAEQLPRIIDDEFFNGHILVDYSKCESKKEIEKKSKKLRDKALKRNWLYQKSISNGDSLSDKELENLEDVRLNN